MIVVLYAIILFYVTSDASKEIRKTEIAKNKDKIAIIQTNLEEIINICELIPTQLPIHSPILGIF